MRIELLVGAAVALSFVVDVAKAGDALDAPACRQAVQRLEQQEATASAARRDGAGLSNEARAALAAAQREASRACLQGTPDAIAPRSVQAPIVVAPVEASKPAPTARLPAAPSPPVVTPPIATPKTLTTCDPLGCWTNDGTRLQRAGPSLLGPRGLCSGSGAVVTCP